ncbi:DUF2334 domain-containing protein [Rummeliibacillus stabekisii]|uniref:DUF2334 domain-containing protein n=1 Tax=Rummeliibacillus stabekisii TaxID=241244 RepID=UPI00116BFD33|nr:DUF2334 domain-containing protein [Rummeliibacillus stabekisii]MBB5170268.1 uncharacterized protein YdaL [Rummeliibacillus stabekisii]GEL04528.1 hypothetical protein RST01_11550 [Rummeliibacillus stabekisii]
MSYKKFWLFTLVLLGSVIYAGNTYASAKEKDTAIVYMTSDGRVNEDIVALQEMLESVVSVDIFPVELLTDNNLKQYRRLVFISTYKEKVPLKAKRAMEHFKGQALAIGENATQLKPFGKWRDRENIKLRKIGNYSLTEPIRWHAMIPPKEQWKVLVHASTLTQKVPFVSRSLHSNWSYMGDLMSSTDFVYSWPHLFSQVLGIQFQNTHPAYIVLTNINMKTNLTKLKETINELSSRHIPLHLAITPIYKEKDGSSYYIQDNKKLVKYLRSLQQRGASLILSPSGNEVDNSLEYMVLNKLYPTIISNPIKGFTAALHEHSHHFYMAKQDGHIIYPINVNQIQESTETSINQFQVSLARLRNVPGSAIGMPYPVYLGAPLMEKIISTLEDTQMPIEWIDFRKSQLQVKTKKVDIKQEKSGALHVKKSFTIKDRLQMYFQERPFEVILWAILVVVTVFVGIFFINTLRLRITLRKRLFEERNEHG